MSAPGRGEMVALSLPSFVYAGFELGRRSYLPALLMGQARLGVAQTGLVLTVIGVWSIAVEVLFGMICDMAPDPRRRRAFWVLAGTGVQLVGGLALWLVPRLFPVLDGSVGVWLACLLALTGGWVLSNLAHGAWALERASGVAARARIFAVRAQFGTAGFVVFALVVLLGERWLPGGGPDPFILILALTMLGALLAHGLLVWRVGERGQLPSAPSARSLAEAARLHLANVLKPFQVCIASPADRRLALLFLLVGAHMALLGSSLLLVIRSRLGLAGWGPTAILVQTVAAGSGVALAQGVLRHASPLRIMAGVFVINLALALWLPLLPPGQVAPMMLWVMGSGATMAVDFTMLRVLLGTRLDREAARDGGAPAAAFYAGFHLPFNLGATVAVAALFQGLAVLEADGGAARQAAHAGAGLVWLTGGLAAMVSMLALLGAVALRRALRREAGQDAGDIDLNFRIFADEKIAF